MTSSRPTTDAMTPERIESAPRRGADRLLLQIGQLGGQRARPQDQRQVLHFFLREAAGDLPVGRDAAFDARRRLHAAVEHDRELAADVLAASPCRTCGRLRCSA